MESAVSVLGELEIEIEGRWKGRMRKKECRGVVCMY